MNKAIVTGTAGFIGSHLCERLVKEGVEVIGIDALTDYYDLEEKLSNLSQIRAMGVKEIVEQDLATADLQSHFQGADCVFHLAGRPGVRPSFEDYQSYVHDNLVATAKVVETSLRAGVKRVVYASSSSVYGNAPIPYSEDGPTSPISPYGRTKLIAEEMVLSAQEAGLEVVALRYFTVFGPRQRPDMAIRRFIEAALSGQEVQIFGDGEQSRDFTFVKDIVEATWSAAVADASGPINIGGGCKVSVNEVLEMVGELVGRAVPCRYVSASRGDPMHTAAELGKAVKLLDFSSTNSFEEGLLEEVDWVKEKAKAKSSSLGRAS